MRPIGVGQTKRTNRQRKNVANWIFAQTTHVVGSNSNFASR